MSPTSRSNAYNDSPDIRMNAAINHAEANATVERVAGLRRKLLAKCGFEDFMRRCDSASFLDGYDFAMNLRFDELLDENTALHNKLLDIQMDADKEPQC